MSGRVAFAGLAATIAAGLGTVLQLTGALHSLELATIDWRFAVRGTRPAPRVVIVGIDSTTLAHVNRYPLSRFIYARAIREVAAGRPSAFVVDVQFTEPSDNPAADDALIDAAHDAPGTIFTTDQASAGGATRIFGGGSGLSFSRATPASSRVECNPVCRRDPYEVGGLRTVAVVAASRVTGRPLPSSALGGSAFWIDYAGPAGTVAEIPLWDVAAGRFRRSELRGRVVVLGAYEPSLGDVHDTPFAGGGPMSGPELQANAISTALARAPLRSAPQWTTWLLVVLFGSATPFVALTRRPLRRIVALTILLAVGDLVLTQLLFDGGRIVALAAPMLSVLTGGAAALAVAYFGASLEQEVTRRRLARAERRVVQVGDEERLRVERNLHDGAQQGLLAVGLLLSELRLQLGSRLDAKSDALLTRISATLSEAIGDLRTLSHGAYPAVLRDRGLDAALRSVLDRTPAVVRLEGSVGRRLDPEVEATAYLVACEALANVVKHAHASSAQVTVGVEGEDLHLSVEDDGVGTVDPAGQGLRGVSERVELMGGSLVIAGTAGVGTRVVLRLPAALSGQVPVARR